MKGLIVSLLGLTVLLLMQDLRDDHKLFNSAVYKFIYKDILKNNNENILVSPLSVEVALLLLRSGCKEWTAKEIQKSLFIPDSHQDIESAIQCLLPALTTCSSVTKYLPTELKAQFYYLHIVSKIFVAINYKIKEDFKQNAAEIFQADAENIDFSNQSEAAETINDWVNMKTEGKILNLIDSHDLKSNTRAILVSALDFKGNWVNPFKVTLKKNFYKTATDVVLVDTMNLYKTFLNYYENTELDAKFLELMFRVRRNEKASMIIVLPNEKEGLAALEDQIEQALELPDFSAHFVNVALPKFKIESKNYFKQILESLGVKKAFHKVEADLSGIAGEKGDIMIDEIIQKTVIDVNENGIEATAAEAPMFSPSGLPSEVKYFVADHPFIFYIRIKNLNIFGGRVTMPSQ